MKKSISLLTFSLLTFACFATHNRAGEILYRHISGLTYKVTVVTYTRFQTGGTDRDTLTILWGDGTESNIPRIQINNFGDVTPGNQVNQNIYEGIHTYTSFGKYALSMTDQNRVSNIININGGNSVNTPFFLEDTMIVADPAFYGYNNSIQFNSLAIDVANVNQVWTHNPNAFDIDGDSLVFLLNIPFQAPGIPPPNYVLPPLVDVGNPGHTLTMDPHTGVVVWDFPTLQGTYNFAYIVKEYRNGKYLGFVEREFELFVTAVNNNPPVLPVFHDTCVIAGTFLGINFSATDPNTGQFVFLECDGGPFHVTPPDTAKFTVTGSGVQFANGHFEWQTNCDHVRQQFYEVVFKATDSYVTPLSDVETWIIKVIAPEPKNLTATPQGNNILLNWDNPYFCSGAKKFLGFNIWRREGPNPFAIDTCDHTMNGKGYTLIKKRWHAYSFIDSDVDRGKDYCYRVEGFFGDTTVYPNHAGYEYNTTESLPSNEACTQLKKDVPVITNVSVRNTDAVNGSMYIAWSKPNATDLDTSAGQNPGPYRYDIYRSTGFAGSNLVFVSSFTSPFFATFNDTTFIDTLLNTDSGPYSYQIRFFSSTHEVGTTEIASSVYLSIAASSHQLDLSWNENVPWTNDSFVVYKLNPSATQYDSIAITAIHHFTDAGLANGTTYCYKIKSIGGYSAPGFVDPIINYSEFKCSVPLDTVGPCAPVITLNNSCLDANFSLGDFKNLLEWNNVNTTCADDAIGYYIYYKPTESGTFVIIDSLNSPTSISFVHILDNTIAGCYAVAAIDSFHNIGRLSNVICVVNCPVYELPNVFTPNNTDEFNNIFHPFLPYKYITRVDFKVFNKWGELVFEATNPFLGWNGKYMNTGKDLPEGTYYYVCEVFGAGITGEERLKSLKGFIHLFR